MSPAPTAAEIERAAELLRAGHIVAFPTETVYGLGANALNADAVAEIYRVKGRPPSSPLIVHVDSIAMAQSLAANWPANADRLAQRFWPGPLTLVLEKQPTVPMLVTAGLATVGLRVPAHPVALALIKAARIPLAAPSANRFTQLSPTTADHVRSSLGGDVELILDGGPCPVGIESTVLSLASSHPVLLRPGRVSRAEIEGIIGPVAVASEIPAGSHPAPGMHPRHYSPKTRLLLVEEGKVPSHGTGIYLKHTHAANRSDIAVVQLPRHAEEYAATLYSTFHEADAGTYDWIAVDLPPQGVDWEAIHDRLRRAAS